MVPDAKCQKVLTLADKASAESSEAAFAGSAKSCFAAGVILDQFRYIPVKQKAAYLEGCIASGR